VVRCIKKTFGLVVWEHFARLSVNLNNCKTLKFKKK